MSSLELSKTERLIISLQLRILAALHPDDADAYECQRTAIEHGYTKHFSELTQVLRPEMPESLATDVADVLDMYTKLHYNFADLEEKAGIEPSSMNFPGFSGNDEQTMLGYADFLINELGWFEPLKDRSLNSHFPAMPMYQKMLLVWREQMGKPYNMTAEQIKQVVAARGV